MRNFALVSLALVLPLTAACVATSTPTGSLGVGGAASTSSGTGAGASTASSSSTSGSATTTSSSSTATSTSSSGGGATYSCEVKSTAVHECTVYENLTAAELSAQMADCAEVTGTNGTTCSTVNAIGTCTSTVLGVTGIEIWYSDGETTALEAQTSCESALGTWAAGP